MSGSDPGPDDARPQPSGLGRALSLSRYRRRPWVAAALLALLFALVVLVPRNAGRSRTLPRGHWGAVIACLERDGQVRVIDSHTGALPTSATTEVTIKRTIGDLQLVRMVDAGTPARAAAVVSAGRLVDVRRALYRTAGSIVWAYEENGSPLTETANGGDRALIGYCAAHG